MATTPSLGNDWVTQSVQLNLLQKFTGFLLISIEFTIANDHSTAGNPAKLGGNSRVLP
jgi:hypothetical protein